MRSVGDLIYERPIHGDQIAWMTLDYLNLYRLFVATMYAGLFFTPMMDGVYPPADLLAAKTITLVYLVTSPALFLLGRRAQRRIGSQAMVGLMLDLSFALIMFRLTGGINSGVGVLLVGPMGAAGAIFPLRTSLVYASLASITLLWQIVIDILQGTEGVGHAVPHGLLGATYFATALLGNYLARRARESQAMVRQRSEDLANLATLNEMIIERMRTGILIIDPKLNTQVMNDSAWHQMGMPRHRHGKLADLAPQLMADFEHWQQTGHHRNTPVRLSSGKPQVVARFARLGSGGPGAADTLVFLEDTSMVARRAQELTLSSLGRLSASIAHEIRNPLAAISHSAQLLDESDQLCDADRKLIAIIGRHCNRMNEIIENVLQLARQAPARPEEVLLDAWMERFVREFQRLQDLGRSTLRLDSSVKSVKVRFDPSQLQQVMWNLCQNALKYGRSSELPAQITVRSRYLEEGLGPAIEVIDQGPGISKADRERIFQPFFTSSPDGTGLGLYLCQQLCQANQAVLEYEPAPDGGSVFRVRLSPAATTAPDHPAVSDTTASPDKSR